MLNYVVVNYQINLFALACVRSLVDSILAGGLAGRSILVVHNEITDRQLEHFEGSFRESKVAIRHRRVHHDMLDFYSGNVREKLLRCDHPIALRWLLKYHLRGGRHCFVDSDCVFDGEFDRHVEDVVDGCAMVFPTASSYRESMTAPAFFVDADATRSALLEVPDDVWIRFVPEANGFQKLVTGCPEIDARTISDSLVNVVKLALSRRSDLVARTKFVDWKHVVHFQHSNKILKLPFDPTYDIRELLTPQDVAVDALEGKLLDPVLKERLGLKEVGGLPRGFTPLKEICPFRKL